MIFFEKKKLRAEIARLNAELNSAKIKLETKGLALLNKEREYTSKLEWHIKNPPKYKIGDQSEKNIIVDRQISGAELDVIQSVALLLLIPIAHILNPKQRPIPFPNGYKWKYEVLDTSTQKKEWLTELQLSVLFKDI